MRDVFFIPGAVTLVRADLFEALGGYDPAITYHGDDLELCWSAHVAGARVIVAPGARVTNLKLSEFMFACTLTFSLIICTPCIISASLSLRFFCPL